MLLAIPYLEVTYAGKTALRIEEPLTFDEGERIGVIGSNGAGKTTLIHSILGLTRCRGSIETKLKREEMAVHLQFNHYANTMPIRYILEMVLNTNVRTDKNLQELIHFFDFEECLKKRYSSLSGGQKQRFTIIMVLLQDAPLTFYDEVTSGLDFETRQRLMEKLADWYRGRKNTLFVVSHYYEELEQLADKLLLLDEGRVIAYGRKEDLFRTYCGNAILILDNNEKNRALTAAYPKISAPAHLLALYCKNKEEETAMAVRLVENQVDFKRSGHDIEIMTINAKEVYYAKKGRTEA